jgi:predicted DNA-binding protein
MAEQEIKTTTIKIYDKTKERLEHLKEHKEESFDTLINKAINILNVCMRSPSLAGKILRDIDKSKKRKELLENPDKLMPKKKTASPEIKVITKPTQNGVR